MTEIINKGSASCMQNFVGELVSQSTHTGMIVTSKKTKQMLIKNPPVPLLLNDTDVDRDVDIQVTRRSHLQ